MTYLCVCRKYHKHATVKGFITYFTWRYIRKPIMSIKHGVLMMISKKYANSWRLYQQHLEQERKKFQELLDSFE